MRPATGHRPGARTRLALLLAAGGLLLAACGSPDDSLNGLAIEPAALEPTPEPKFGSPGAGRTLVLPASTPAPALPPPPLDDDVPASATITTSNLNVRTGPGLGFTVLRQLQPGDEIPVAGVSLDGKWVAAPEVGWVYYDAEWMQLDGEFALLKFAEGFEAPEPPPAAVAEPAPTAEPTPESTSVKLGPTVDESATVMRARIITDNLNVRAGPGLSYAVLDKLQPGEKILVAGVSSDGTWVAATGLGWIFYRADWIDLDGNFADLDVTTGFEAPAS
jgi:uncharacterized protein YraI